MKRTRYVLATLLLLLLAVPSNAVFNEKNLSQTLAVLRFELKQEFDKLNSEEYRINMRDESQHTQMVNITKKCNELALMLYSQNQDYTFDMTYALKEVSKEYEEFETLRMPYDDIVASLEVEIDRYSRLLEALHRLPARAIRPRHGNDSTVGRFGHRPDSLMSRGDSLRRHHRDSLRARADSLRRPRPDLVRGNERTIDSLMGTFPQRARFVRDTLLDEENRPRAFLLDEQGRADRDSCILYTQALLSMYLDSRDRIIADNEHYESAATKLKESYSYAQDRYLLLQRRMLTERTDNYIKIIKTPATYVKTAVEEVVGKYSRHQGRSQYIKSEWRGPVVSGFILLVILFLAVSSILSFLIINALYHGVKRLHTEEFRLRKPDLTLTCGALVFLIALGVVSLTIKNNFILQASKLLVMFCWLLLAILASLIIRLKPGALHSGVRMYLPAMVIGLIAITFRIMFIPNRMMNLLLTPVLIGILVWQFRARSKYARGLEVIDRATAVCTLIVLMATVILSFIGYVFLSLLVIVCWLTILAGIETFVALRRLFSIYKKKHKGSGSSLSKTWFVSMVETAVIPVVGVLLVPFSLLLGMQIFDLQEIFRNLFNAEFFDLNGAGGNEILKVSVHMIIMTLALFFVFKYISSLLGEAYKEYKFNKIYQTEGKRHISTNEVNLTLARNVISIIVWGLYIILIFLLFKIPTGAISVVFAGLATGVGLALRDVLTNFIYGIQLMSGRLRVGDWIECDGVRGKVSAISYQSTQIETTDGATMSFLNTALFNKNFKNLTRNNHYEFVKISVGVAYGTDVEKARKVLLEAMEKLRTKDEFDRDILDGSKFVTVVFDDFADSSVNLAVKQYVLVSQRNNYIAAAKEAIYNALNDAGISIPFPQRDIRIIKE